MTTLRALLAAGFIEADASKLPAAAEQGAIPESKTERREEAEKTQLSAGADLDGSFDFFWKAYPTDPLMSKKKAREQWERREYTGDELNKVRNVMILVFLASACGCLFPIMIGVDAHWIWGGGGVYPYVRLPASLQVLLKASFGAACVWAFILIVVMLLSR